MSKKSNNSQPSKKTLIQDLKNISEEFSKEHHCHKFLITRDYYSAHSEYGYMYKKIFGSFAIIRKFAFGDDLIEFNKNRGRQLYKKEEKIEEKVEQTRLEFDIQKSDTKIKKTRRYFVTAAVAGAAVAKNFLNTVLNYCEENNANLVILPMRGVHSTTEGYAKEILEYTDSFATKYVFNSELIAHDFILSPQQINPLTSLSRYGQKKASLIVASPKQQMQVVPVSNQDQPHIMHSTGCITLPNYNNNRIGVLANQDHIIGGLVIEIEDSKTFHIRQIQSSKTIGDFYDLDKYYNGNKIKSARTKAFVMGDYHCGFEEHTAIKAWEECLEITNPKYIIFHDLFDGKSISHHEEKDMHRKINRPKNSKTLEAELNQVGKCLLSWRKKFPNITFIIVRSNHDEFLDRYLTNGRYIDDRFNYRLALELAIYHADEKNPLKEWINNKFNIENTIWLDRDEDFKINGIQLGAHGDVGITRRPSMYQVELGYGKSIIGHKHSPQILRDAWVVGTSTKLKLGYNKGPSNWLHASCSIYKNGQRQMIISRKGKWKI